MRRLEIEPTKDAILESIAGNRMGRNDDIVQFVKLLADTEGPFTYMVDAAWGDGKTFFLRSVEFVLKALNPQISLEERDSPKLKPLLDEFSEIDVSILPYYFNAWSNDYAEDPITALFADMAAEFDRDDLLKSAKLKEGVTTIVDAALSFSPLPLRVKPVADALTSESLISAYKLRKEIRSRINELADTSIIEVANKLVIFIDELDRCRPDFAIRLLEQSKNLFASENIVIVFAADSSQLAKAVGGAYGPGFDSSLFLERFFDERLTMTPVHAEELIFPSNSFGNTQRFDSLARELLSSRPRSIRDAQKISPKLDAARQYCMRDPCNDAAHLIANSTILPLLVFVQREDIDSFRAIVSGSDLDRLYEIGSKYKQFNNNVMDVLKQGNYLGYLNKESESYDSSGVRSFMHDLCMIVFGTPTMRHPDYYESERKLDSFVPVAFDSKVFKQLEFGGDS